jgi:tetratricopeptide (TPR) repeat protein
MMLVISASGTADDDMATQVLKTSYELPSDASQKEHDTMIKELEQALPQCQDPFVASRVRYRLGVLHFQVGRLVEANRLFEALGSNPDCPIKVKLASLNMTGQTYRLIGESTKAIGAFDRLLTLLAEETTLTREDNASWAKLACLAGFSMAEIHQYREEYASSIEAYLRVMTFLAKQESAKLIQEYSPLALDRISQLHLTQGNCDEYTQYIRKLVAEFPAYDRIPMIELEAKCVEFSRNHDIKVDFSTGSPRVPVQVIGWTKNMFDKSQAAELAEAFRSICQKYLSTIWIDLLNFHLASLLDAMDRGRDAAEVFATIASVDHADSSISPKRKAVLQSIQNYATIQLAIVLGEQGKYPEALRILRATGSQPNQSHLAGLVGSVEKNLQSLAREVRNSEIR